LTDDALTLAVLKEIRDEIRTTRTDVNERLDRTNERLDQTNERLDETNFRLGHLETTMNELAHQQSFVVRWLKAGTARDRRMETGLVKLTARVDAIEARIPDTEE